MPKGKHDKWKRMAAHVAASERARGKSAEEAKRIGYAAATDRLGLKKSRRAKSTGSKRQRRHVRRKR